MRLALAKLKPASNEGVSKTGALTPRRHCCGSYGFLDFFCWFGCRVRRRCPYAVLRRPGLAAGVRAASRVQRSGFRSHLVVPLRFRVLKGSGLRPESMRGQLGTGDSGNPQPIQ